MTGLGMIVLYIGYAALYWAIESFQGNDQQSFISYLVPFAPQTPSDVGAVGTKTSNSTPAPTPADVKKTANPGVPNAVSNSGG